MNIMRAKQLDLLLILLAYKLIKSLFYKHGKRKGVIGTADIDLPHPTCYTTVSQELVQER